MLSDNRHYHLIAALLILFSMPLHADNDNQEFMTLFTTQQERRLIDNNRYRQPVIETETVGVDETEQEQQTTVYQQHNISFELAGVTLSEDGNHVAWVNGDRVESGDELVDGFRVFISPKLNNLVQIKGPDGVYHNIQTGKKLDISYLKPEEG